jgi:hypothetical protein
MVLQVSYDLRGDQPVDVYQDLEDAIKAYGYWLHFQKSEWLIWTSDSPKSVAENLWRHMRSSDRLMVIQVQENWWAYNLSEDQVAWMKARIF